MVSFRKVLAVTGAMAMIAGMAACGGASSSGQEVSFQTWNLKNDTYTPYFNDLIAKFEKDNPGVTIKWIDQPADGYTDKINADAAAGTLPDIVDMSPNGAYGLAKAGVVANLSKDDPDGEGQFTASSWKAVTFDGKNIERGAYAYPWYLNSGVQYYNKAVLDRCGVGQPPTTLDAWFDAAKTLGANCPGTNMTASIPTIESLGGYGAQLMNKDQTEFTFNDAKGVEMVQHYVDMYNEKALSADALNNQWTGEGDAFKQGDVASLGVRRVGLQGERPQGLREPGHRPGHGRRRRQEQRRHGDAGGEQERQAQGHGDQVRPLRDERRQPDRILHQVAHLPLGQERRRLPGVPPDRRFDAGAGRGDGLEADLRGQLVRLARAVLGARQDGAARAGGAGHPGQAERAGGPG